MSPGLVWHRHLPPTLEGGARLQAQGMSGQMNWRTCCGPGELEDRQVIARLDSVFIEARVQE